LSKLARVRIMIRRFEILRRSSIHFVTAHECSEVPKQIASELQMTDRNAGRYLAVLRSPRIVQGFFESERLTLQDAAKATSRALLLRTLTASSQSRLRLSHTPLVRCFSFRGQSNSLNRHDCYWFSNSVGVR
jgi:hypothetical protein